MVERDPKNIEEPLPRRIGPMLSVPAKRIPKDASDRICELYFPGIRVIAYIDKDKGVRIMTRQNDNIVDNFETIFEDLWAVAHKKSLVLDGNIVCANGHSPQKAAEIKAKQNQLQQKLNPIGLCYFLVNDVLYANGQNLLTTPLIERKRILDKIIPERRSSIIPLPYSETDQKSIRRSARSLHVKQVSYRKKDGTYKQGVRSKDWVRTIVR